MAFDKNHPIFDSPEFRESTEVANQLNRDISTRREALAEEHGKNGSARYHLSFITMAAATRGYHTTGMQHAAGDLYTTRQAYGYALGIGDEDLIARAREVLHTTLAFEAKVKNFDDDYPDKTIQTIDGWAQETLERSDLISMGGGK